MLVRLITMSQRHSKPYFCRVCRGVRDCVRPEPFVFRGFTFEPYWYVCPLCGTMPDESDKWEDDD